MHLGGNLSWVPLTNKALSIIIYVKTSRYATLRRMKRCKRVLYLVLHRTRKTRICKLKTLWNTRLRCKKHRGKRVSVSGYIMVSPFFHVYVAAFIADETITIIWSSTTENTFFFFNFDETMKSYQSMLKSESIKGTEKGRGDSRIRLPNVDHCHGLRGRIIFRELANGNTAGAFGFEKLNKEKMWFLSWILHHEFDSPSFTEQWDNVHWKINTKCRGKRKTVVKRLQRQI